MTRIIYLADEAATARLGQALASLARPGAVIALGGSLGAGKSTLARAAIPTRTIMVRAALTMSRPAPPPPC